MSREIKIGALALSVLLVSIWGFTYLKGRNILKSSFNFETTYDNVSQLTKTAPVYINGYKVGAVMNIRMNPENLQEMIVSFNVEEDYKIPNNATAELISDGLVAGKAISIEFDKSCSGADCAKSGERLKGKVLGMLASMIGTDEIKEYASAIGTELSTVIEDLGTEDGKGAINKTLLDLQKTMENMAQLTATTNRIMAQSASSLTQTIKNMSSITGNLAENNEQITAMLNNFTAVSSQIKDANIGNTITSTTATIEDAQKVMTSLQGTLENADKAMLNLNDLIAKASTGDGTLANLMNDKELYNNLEMTSKNLSLLLQDVRLNPSRYVKVSVFGRKNKDPYVKPENDPAFQDEK